MSEIIALLMGAFSMGFLAQTHCVGMCGPVIGILGMNNTYKRIPAAILYNLGRISTYTLLGIIVGILGSAISDIASVQYIIRYIAGAVMIFVALQLLGLPQLMAFIEKPAQKIWKPIRQFSQRLFPIKTALGTYIVGVIWGFLPCGAVYAPLAVALGTGSISLSAGMMLAFGLGTLPIMLGLAIFGNFIGRFFSKPKVRIAAGLIILAMTLYYLLTIAPKERVMMRAKMVQQQTDMIKSGRIDATKAIDNLNSMKHGQSKTPQNDQHSEHNSRQLDDITKDQ